MTFEILQIVQVMEEDLLFSAYFHHYPASYLFVKNFLKTRMSFNHILQKINTYHINVILNGANFDRGHA